MSQIEKIGTALFGRSWMAQVASSLQNEKGEPLSLQTVQGWHNRDNLPIWAKQELTSIAEQRLTEIKSITQYLKGLAMNAFTQQENNQTVRYTPLKSNNKIWYREVLGKNLEVIEAQQFEFDTDDVTQDEVIEAFK